MRIIRAVDYFLTIGLIINITVHNISGKIFLDILQRDFREKKKFLFSNGVNCLHRLSEIHYS